MYRETVRFVAMVIATLVAGTAVGALCRYTGLLQAEPLAATMVAGLSGAAIVWLYSRAGRAGFWEFATTAGRQTDRMMTGAAGTTFFIASVKKKVEQDVAGTEDIVRGTEESDDANSASRLTDELKKQSQYRLQETRNRP